MKDERITVNRKCMRHVILLAVGFAAAPIRGHAQAARVDRLPVLELHTPGVGECRNDPATPALRRDGVARIVTFQSSDSTRHRLVSLGMDAKGRSILLMAIMGTTQGRRGESETVQVSFAPDGAIVRGRRSAFTTGTPARRSDDRHLGLLPTDSMAIHRLDAALRQRCRA